MTADPLPPLREVIAGIGLSAKKSLGQNFILDLNITRKIARHIPGLENAHVLEIGPGPGGLTRALLMEGAKKVTAIEKDERTLPALEAIKEIYPTRFEFQLADALEIDESKLFEPGEDVHIAANLPYNIASVLLGKWLEAEPPFFNSITVMLQREMAERFIAEPGTKAYGRLSVMAQWRCKPKILFNLPAAAFTPAPKVTSSVVQLIPTDPAVEGLSGKDIAAFTHLLFSKRRKTLRNVLQPLGQDVALILEGEGVDASLRAENLKIEEICRLAKRFKA